MVETDYDRAWPNYDVPTGATYVFGSYAADLRHQNVNRLCVCTTNSGGGAIGACAYGGNPHIYIENSLFKNNRNNCWASDPLSNTAGYGGAIALMDKGSLTVLNNIFIANSAAYGTAISAFDVDGYGSPDVIIVNNSFINHTRHDDVLNVRVKNTILNISNNYYYGNSIVFSCLNLTKLSDGKEQATLQINLSLATPGRYDADILNKTLFDVYVNNNYVKTVNSTLFTVDYNTPGWMMTPSPTMVSAMSVQLG